MKDIKGHIQCLIENVGLNAIRHKDQKQVIEEAEKVINEIVKNCSIPDVIGHLQSLKRYDAEICGGCQCCGSWVELDEYPSGDLAKWEDIEKLIEVLKTDNAL